MNSNEDTLCEGIMCSRNEYVHNNTCTPCPPGTDYKSYCISPNGELLPEFEETVVNMVIGEYSDILIMNMGYVVIQRLN